MKTCVEIEPIVQELITKFKARMDESGFQVRLEFARKPAPFLHGPVQQGGVCGYMPNHLRIIRHPQTFGYALERFLDDHWMLITRDDEAIRHCPWCGDTSFPDKERDIG